MTTLDEVHLNLQTAYHQLNLAAVSMSEHNMNDRVAELSQCLELIGKSDDEVKAIIGSRSANKGLTRGHD